MNHVIRPAARDDIVRQFRYYLLEKEAPEAALRFVEAVHATIDALCSQPNSGAPKPVRNRSLAGLRFRPVKGFEDILIYYVVQPDTMRIIRLIHGRRDVNRILEREKPDEAAH